MMRQTATKLPASELYGDILRTYSFSDLTLVETTYAPGSELPEHAHECAYLCLVLQGTYSEVYANQTRIYKPSTLIFHSPGEMHSDYFHSAGGRCFNVQLSSYWLNRLREHSVVPESRTDFNGGRLVNLATKLYQEFRLMDEAAPLAIEGLMLEIMAEASRHAKLRAERRTPRRIERAQEFLHANFRESIGLERLAKSVDAHPVYLAREFRRHLGCTVGEYIRRLRVEFACSKLSSSDEPLANIALAAGFSDQSHFSRTFRNFTGMPPAQYRKVHRER